MNIRGVGDLENNNQGNSNSNRQGMPLLTSNFISSNPRKESFFFFMRSMCCPLSTWKSFIAVIAVINILVYIVTLSFGITEAKKENPSFLAPLESTMEWGFLWRIKLRNLELWRWVSYAFLHTNFIHILFNTFTLVMFGSFIERMIGTVKTMLLYFYTAIAGALFSVLIDSSKSIGASIGVCGLIGGYLAFYFINWNYLDTIYGPTNKMFNVFFLILMLLINLSTPMTVSFVNNWGHLGGLITGFFMMYVLKKPYREGDGACCSYKIWNIIGAGFTLTFNVVGFSLFYLLDFYKN